VRSEPAVKTARAGNAVKPAQHDAEARERLKKFSSTG
jgi:hypothetical protein